MKLKQLLLGLTALISCGLFAQESFPPEEVIVGTYMGKTVSLRDFLRGFLNKFEK